MSIYQYIRYIPQALGEGVGEYIIEYIPV